MSFPLGNNSVTGWFTEDRVATRGFDVVTRANLAPLCQHSDFYFLCSSI